MKNKILSIIAAVLLTVSAVAIAATPAKISTDFTPAQTKQIQDIVHSYLVKNPGVLLEASQALQRQQLARIQKAAVVAIKSNSQKLFNNAASPSVGNVNAPIQMIEFFDYQCGHCKAMRPVIAKLIKNNPNVRVIFKELPIFGANSTFAAKAALASVKQGKYYAFHNALLAASDPLTNDKVFSVAKKVGLNVAKLKKDMQNRAYAMQIKANFKLAENLRLIGTPAFVFGNKQHTKFQFIPGAAPAAQLQQAIDAVK
ncbi:MAG: DsbA family protein [Gammaproteobacteria bacterium]|nr:DsbA family protein [Gammaproteobacteria bacterium]